MAVMGLLAQEEVSAQSRPAPKKVRDKTMVGRQARITDPAAGQPLQWPGDARAFEAKVVGESVVCVLEMARPLADGMFTMVELWIDCDDKPETGIDGRELRIRAAVGSRFQPSSAQPSHGELHPIEHVRISGTKLSKGEDGTNTWLHCDIEADPPEVAGKELRFSFPRRVLREGGDRYHGRVSMQVTVETSCSDQPVEKMHSCADEGVPIRVDGSSAEWSARLVGDAPDELHSVAQCIDITGLRVDHGNGFLFACVDLAKNGFSSWVPDSDVQGVPTLTILVEPVFPRYMNPYEVTVAGSARQSNGVIPQGNWSSASGDRMLEIVLPRASGQNKVRMIVVSDLILSDRFDSEVRIDTETK